ncbi:SDR family oxidoreductase [Nocardioides dongxiaopingii]|uniref:SDR family NAD(P)-dependent oxidoreductase n=1 Tax=Nocardioides sp. S-1144 TaxID=2582905 RepID=UPI001165993A|nr:SDR family oxidoreductase [Nocardioides sp. S-1144]QCW49997.2 SDR family oxidoreductase [Nocardioides sp. S-1144]
MTRNAVVTGGGTGLGRAIAARLAADGCDVLVVGRREQPLNETADAVNAGLGRAAVRAYSADLTDPDAVAGLAEAAPEQVHVLVNNAGGNYAAGRDDLAAVADGFRADFEGNVITAVLTTEALLPRIARPGGRIVLMSSIAGLRGAGPYAAAKAALHGWGLGLATQLAPEEITVNVVAPGFVPDTEFWSARMTDELYASRVGPIPMNRPGTPEEVAAAVAYLAAEDAGWTTGQIVQVNGGTLLGRG